jgi:hypothetical protein
MNLMTALTEKWVRAGRNTYAIEARLGVRHNKKAPAIAAAGWQNYDRT